MHDLVNRLDKVMPTAITGRVLGTVGMTATVTDFPAPLGSLVQIDRQLGKRVEAEVIGFRDQQTLVYPLSSLAGVRRGNRVRLIRTTRSLSVGQDLLGRIINAQGHTIDGNPRPLLTDRVDLDRKPPPPMERPRIDQPLPTGIRAIDGLLTCGKGQRMGIFSGSGVGKSVLLGMMGCGTAADVNVIALVGERGREVNDFIQRNLGPVGLARSVVVVATSDESALQRVQAAFTATAIAEYFRDQGKDVLLLMDSITRFAMAQREIGLAAGEPPTTKGYPPSVFALLPRLLERAGRHPDGSITAFYTVLVEGDDANEPIVDAARGLLDGHTWLSRQLAARGHYPAIDVVQSISRLMMDVTPPNIYAATMLVRRLLGTYRDHEDSISLGTYRRGNDPSTDTAIDMFTLINAFLQQKIGESSPLEVARRDLMQLSDRCRAQLELAVTPNGLPENGSQMPTGNSLLPDQLHF